MEAKTHGRITEVFSLIVLVLIIAVLAGTGYVIVFGLGQFRVMYLDLELALPAYTLFVLSINHLSYTILLLIAMSALIAKEALIANKRTTLRINIIAGAAAILWLGFLVNALFLPLMNSMTEIGH